MSIISNVLIVAALEQELAPTIKRLKLSSQSSFYAGQYKNHKITAVVSGMGPHRIVQSVQALIQPSPAHAPPSNPLHTHPYTHLILIGFAAGLDPKLPPATVIHATQTQSEDPQTIQLLSTPTELPQTIPDTTQGPLLTITNIAHTPAQKNQLYQAHHCLAADNEAHVLAQFAKDNALPLTVLKAISDPATMALPKNIANWISPQGHPKPFAIAAHLLTHPHHIPIIVRLARFSNKAAHHLANTIQTILDRSIGIDPSPYMQSDNF